MADDNDKPAPTAGQVPVKGPDGSLGTVAPEDVQNAIASGYTLATPEEWQAGGEEQRKAKAYGDSPVIAALEGAGRGFLPGVAPLLESGLGVSQEGQRERAERNPVSAGVGEVGGVLGGTLALGGIGDAAAIGEGAEGALAATREATPLAGRLAKAAAINAGYGAGQAVNEAELGEAPLTGQAVLAGAGMGALLGAGGEGLFALGERVIPPMISAASDATEKLGAKAADLFDSFHAWKSDKPIEEIRAARLAGLATGPEAFGPEALAAEKDAALNANASNKQAFKDWQNVQKKEAKDASRAQKTAYNDSLTKMSGDTATSLNDFVAGHNDLLSDVNQRARPEQIQNFSPKVPADQAVEGAQAMIEQTKANLDALGEQAIHKGSAQLGMARNLLDELDGKVADIRESGGTMADVHDAVNQYKQDLGTVIFDRDVTAGPAKKTLDALKNSVWPDAKGLIEDKGVFGDLAPKTAAWNGAQSDFITDRDDVLKALGAKKKVRGTVQSQVVGGKIESMLMGGSIDHPLGIPGSKAAELQGKIDRMMASGKRLQDAAKDVYSDTSMTAPDPSELRDLLDSVTGNRQAAADVIASHPQGPIAPALGEAPEKVLPSGPATTVNKLKGGKLGEALEGIRGEGALGVAGLASHALGLPVGPALAVAGAVRFAGNTAKQLETLARLNQVVQTVKRAVSSGAAAFVRSGAGSVARGTIEKTAAMQAMSGGRRDALKGRDDFAKRSAELDNLSTNPQLLANTMQRNTTRIHDAAPNITLQAQTAVARGVQYLQSVKPKNPNIPGLVPTSEKWEPSESELAAYAPLHEVVADPMTTLSHMRNGTLTQAMVGAFTATAPDLHAYCCQVLQQTLIDHPKQAAKMDYGSRLQLATFLGEPVDAATSPSFALAMMGPPQPPPGSAPAPKPVRQSQAGLKNLDFAGQAATPSQDRQLSGKEA